MLHDLVRHNTTVFSRVTRSCRALSVTHVNRHALARSVLSGKSTNERITNDRKAVDSTDTETTDTKMHRTQLKMHKSDRPNS